ncbi:MAG: dihydropteroate synthase [Oscillochloris sp.]|nr:dihydropteroate synthase [Oscillochloris sp.]
MIPPLTIGNTVFTWGQRTYIMGILNVTPDSFSGDGVLAQADWVAAAVAQALNQIAAGADIIDIGGESTRPGSQPVSSDEELARVIPAIRALANATDVPISIDTSKAEVARQALAVGATIINDVWGFKLDPAMAQVAAEYGAAVVLMHNRSQPKDTIQDALLGGRYVGVHYDDLLQDVARELTESLTLAHTAGVAPAQIILDPGLGFGKTVEQNLELIDRLGELRRLGYPLLVGPSRKSFTGAALQLPIDQRLEGTAAAVALAIDRGADIIRVHDVGAMRRVAVLSDAITRGQAQGT